MAKHGHTEATLGVCMCVCVFSFYLQAVLCITHTSCVAVHLLFLYLPQLSSTSKAGLLTTKQKVLKKTKTNKTKGYP